MSKRLHSDAGDSCLSLPFFVCPQDTYHPKMCDFLSALRFLILSAQGPLLLTSCMVSHTHLSLLISSCVYVCVCSAMFDFMQPHGLYPTQAPESMGFPRQEHWSL